MSTFASLVSTLPSPKTGSKARGFTLIELMIVVVVAAILMAIAIPNYTAYVNRSHRAHAKAALLKIAQWMERTATAQGRYPSGNTTSVLHGAGLDVVEGGRYNVLLASNATTFTLRATRDPNMGNKNDKCGTFTLNHAGVRGLQDNDPSMTITECWGR